MSLTIANARLNVRVLLNDLQEAAYAISDERLTRVLVRQNQLMRAASGQPDWGDGEQAGTPEIVSILDTGYSDFAFNEDYQIDRVTQVSRLSDGYILTRRTFDELEALRAGNPVPTGKPTDYVLIETPGATGMLIRLHPRPIAADSLNVWSNATAIPPAYTDATVLEGAELAMRATELNTAVEAAALMTQAERERLNLNPEVVAGWKSDAARFERLERERHNRLRTSVGRIPAQVY